MRIWGQKTNSSESDKASGSHKETYLLLEWSTVGQKIKELFKSQISRDIFIAVQDRNLESIGKTLNPEKCRASILLDILRILTLQHPRCSRNSETAFAPLELALLQYFWDSRNLYKTADATHTDILTTCLSLTNK